MSAVHTEGRLSVDYFKGGADLTRADGVVIGIEMTHADARRLAACWNAFVGTSTEAIEANVPRAEIAGLIAERDELNKDLAAARALLEQAVDGEWWNMSATLCQEIRAFLKGGE